MTVALLLATGLPHHEIQGIWPYAASGAARAIGKTAASSARNAIIEGVTAFRDVLAPSNRVGKAAD